MLIFTSASRLWQCAVECCCLIVRVCSGTGLCYDDLYCSLISSLGFPLASSPHPLILFTVQPSIILPLSEGAAKLSGTWKQLFFCVWEDTTCSSDRLFCPPSQAQLTVRQTDFLLLPHLLRLVLKEVVMFIKNGRRYLSPRPQSDSEPLISLTYRWNKGAFSPASECLKHCEADWESKSRKNITMCRFISNKSSLAQLQNTGGKHPSGTQDRSSDEAEKTLYILPVSGSPILAFLLVRHKRLSCQSSDLCWLWNSIFHEGSFRAGVLNAFLLSSV